MTVDKKKTQTDKTHAIMSVKVKYGVLNPSSAFYSMAFFTWNYQATVITIKYEKGNSH